MSDIFIICLGTRKRIT